MKLNPLELSPRIRNPILLGVGATLCFLTLAAYSPIDPGWIDASNNSAIRSIFGSVGSLLSGALIGSVGYAAYAIPVLLVAKILSIIVRPRVENWWLGLLALLGFLVSLVSMSWMAAAWVGGPAESVQEAAGLVGLGFAHLSFGVLNAKVVAIISAIGFLLGLQLMLQFSWPYVLDMVGKSLYFVGTYSYKFVKQGVLQLLPQFHTEKKSQNRTPTKRSPTLTPQQPRSPAASKTESTKRREPTLKPVQAVRKRTPSKLAKNRKRFDKNPQLPPLDLLDDFKEGTITQASRESIRRVTDQLATKLADFGVEAEVVSVLTGPVVSRFEIQPAPGLKVSKIVSIAKDLARALAVLSVRIVEVIPGKSVIGIEIPNQDRETVRLKEILFHTRRSGAMRAPLDIVLGKDVAGEPVIANIEKMPHLLVAGTTGSGKSVYVNVILLSLLLHTTPEQIRLILIDPKMLELSVYEEIPHLLTPVVTDMQEASRALGWCIAEMERRYSLMAALSVRNLAGYNALIDTAEKNGESILDPTLEEDILSKSEPLTRLPSIVVVIDEFADMIMIVGKKVEQLIARLAQKARAAGIHLILATQRPSVDVITGLIKANIPCRISFQVTTATDSRTILDQGGAEQLLSHGDMLYLPSGSGVPIRVHGAFVSDSEVIKVAEFLRDNGEPEYFEDVTSGEGTSSSSSPMFLNPEEDDDENYAEAVEFVLRTKKVSISSVQRKFRIGYNRAARIVESMEDRGIVSAPDEKGNRQLLATPE